jgi:hypothetical protein
MTEASDPPSSRRIGRATREVRLARALRDNLRRRKEQARAQTQAGGESAAAAAPPPCGGCEEPSH